MNVDWITIIGCYASTNLMSAALMAFDKWCAVNGWYRISENVLSLTALVGGWPGGWPVNANHANALMYRAAHPIIMWAMRACNHKTMKQSFQVMYGCHACLGVLLLIGAMTQYAEKRFDRLMVLTFVAYGGLATLCIIWVLALVWAFSSIPHTTAQRRTAQHSSLPAGPVRLRNPPRRVDGGYRLSRRGLGWTGR